ncbi:MAG: hypothetical protein ACRDTH_02165 [Pseudonocardiaceae bacterium]
MHGPGGLSGYAGTVATSTTGRATVTAASALGPSWPLVAFTEPSSGSASAPARRTALGLAEPREE